MHKDRILQLADALETGKRHVNFDMSHYITPCGTAACIAGHALLMYAGVTPLDLCILRTLEIKRSAAYVLGLSYDQGSEIFNPMEAQFNELNLKRVTTTDAASVLRNLVKTGEVDWSGVILAHHHRSLP